MPKVPAPHRNLTPSSPSHLTMEHPPKTASYISMTAEIQELLSQAMLDTSSEASGDCTPKRPPSVALGTPASTRVEDPFEHIATALQASLWVATPDDTMLISHSPTPTLASENPEAAIVPTALPSMTPSGADMGALSNEVLWLRGDEQGHGAIAYNKGVYRCPLQKANIRHWNSLLSKWGPSPKAIGQVKAHCTAPIREAEATCADHVHTIQQLHSDNMQHLEREAMEKEGRDHLSFLAACRVALYVCPWDAMGY